MPYQHRPLSNILAPASDPKPEGQNTTQLPLRDPKTGKFVSPEQPQQEQAQATEFQLPEKYRNKSVEDVAQMHMNAEQELGRLRNEVGTYRGLVSDLSTLQRTAPASQPVEKQKIDVSGDELLKDPSGTIDKVVTARLAEAPVPTQPQQPTVDPVVEAEGRALMAQYPNLDAIIQTPEFTEFVQRTPSRQADFQTAATGTGIEQVRAARRLLEDFTDFGGNTQPSTTQTGQPAPTGQPPTQQPQQQAPQVPVTEGAGSAGPISSKPVIYESDVLKLIQEDKATYMSPSFQKELMDAMKEGRYIKQSG